MNPNGDNRQLGHAYHAKCYSPVAVRKNLLNVAGWTEHRPTSFLKHCLLKRDWCDCLDSLDAMLFDSCTFLGRVIMNIIKPTSFI